MAIKQNISRAEEIIARCREIAACTDVAGTTTRIFLSPSMHNVHSLVRGWMEHAGMSVWVDAIGNIRGIYESSSPDAPCLLIGSHLDTVPNAGAFDGILGVIMGIALVEELAFKRLPFSIEVIGFSEEEGVRFKKSFLSSMAFSGTFEESFLSLKDLDGTSVSDAIRQFGLNPCEIAAVRYPSSAFAYIEIHIEQGPVLESMDQPLGVVNAIVGQTRLLATFTGKANHAGTTPMQLRRDALAAASEWVIAVERIASSHQGLVATVGSIRVTPDAANVIAGEAVTTLDIRHADDKTKTVVLKQMLEEANAICDRRGIKFSWKETMDQAAILMDTHLTEHLEAAVKNAGAKPIRLTSGAGHDAMIIAPHIPSCMLFLRSPGGLSHHPNETVLSNDVATALAAGDNFIHLISETRREA